MYVGRASEEGDDHERLSTSMATFQQPFQNYCPPTLALEAAPLGTEVPQRRPHGDELRKVHAVHGLRFHERPRVVHVVPPRPPRPLDVPHGPDRARVEAWTVTFFTQPPRSTDGAGIKAAPERDRPLDLTFKAFDIAA